jgi:hypothetical protein
MESVSAPAVASGIYALTPSRVAALANLALLPPLPNHVEQLRTFETEPIPSGVVERCLWFATGDDFMPTGIIGAEVRFDPGYLRWSLEVIELRGRSFFAMRRLLRHVAAIARERGYLLTGELHADNARMRRFMERVFGRTRIDRVRYTWEFN